MIGRWSSVIIIEDFARSLRPLLSAPRGWNTVRRTHDKFLHFVDFGGPRGALSTPLVTHEICNTWSQYSSFIIIIGDAGWKTRESEVDSRWRHRLFLLLIAYVRSCAHSLSYLTGVGLFP
jgi:hypothetical protein